MNGVLAISRAAGLIASLATGLVLLAAHGPPRSTSWSSGPERPG